MAGAFLCFWISKVLRDINADKLAKSFRGVFERRIGPIRVILGRGAFEHRFCEKAGELRAVESLFRPSRIRR